MARAKSPAEWTPTYRARMERAFKANPYATKTEARRGANSKEARAEHKGDKDHWQERAIGDARAKLSNVKLRGELNVMTPAEVKQAESILKEIIQLQKEKFETAVAGSRKDRDLQFEISKRYHLLADKGVIGSLAVDSFGRIYYKDGGD